MEIPSHFSNRSPRVKFWPWWSQGNLHSLSLRQEPSLITSYTCNCEMWKGKEKLFPWVLPWGNTFSRQLESLWEMSRKETQKCRKSEMGNRQGSSSTEHFQSWTGTTHQVCFCLRENGALALWLEEHSKLLINWSQKWTKSCKTNLKNFRALGQNLAQTQDPLLEILLK